MENQNKEISEAIACAVQDAFKAALTENEALESIFNKANHIAKDMISLSKKVIR